MGRAVNQEVTVMSTVEIRPAEGGDDAVRFAGELRDAVCAGARRSGADVRVTATAERGHTLELSAAPG